MRLRDLDYKPLYLVPRDRFGEDVLIRSLARSKSFDCMFGFFTSASLGMIAPGLAVYLAHAKEPMRLIASPNISEKDTEALHQGVSTPSEVLEARLRDLLGEVQITQLKASAIVQHTLACLAYMLSTRQLQIRFAWLRNGGLFHSKVWFLQDGTDTLVAHGSSNMTAHGLEANHEQIRVDATWDGPRAQSAISTLRNEFNALWSGTTDYALSLDLPVALEHDLVRAYAPDHPPTLEDFRTAWKKDRRVIEDLDKSASRGMRKLRIPAHLDLDNGPFSHQGRAITAWEQAGRRGILAMATGSGKTVAALAAATRLQAETSSLLITISAPYRPLIAQWIEEVKAFGIKPLSVAGTTEVRAKRFELAVQRLQMSESQVEIQVVTLDFLASNSFRCVLDAIPASVTTLLIADEVHNLGQLRFQGNMPERFDYRLGLSATPQRQYDPEGTEALLDFCGPIVFEFTLQEAIGVCLVPYSYYIHPVSLTEDEYETWVDLTQRLSLLGWGKREDVDPDETGQLSKQEQQLLNARRRIIEAAENKVDALCHILQNRTRDDIQHALVYTTDKNREQLLVVNHMLQHDLNLIIHEFTARETANRTRSANLLNRFAAGDYHILTCMRVLDEGVDIPQVKEAFLLASNTVRRQWIQRRGRVLRQCTATGKQSACLHDFVVVPPNLEEPEARKILESELARTYEFAELADNSSTSGGPFDVILSLSSLMKR